MKLRTPFKGGFVMLYPNYTEEMLGLKDAIVTKVETIEGKTHLFLEMKLQTQVCPHCHHETKRTHDYRMQKVKDLSLFGSLTILHLRKRRYFCPHCNGRFNEKISFLPRYQRHTTRLTAYIFDEFRKTHSTKSISDRHNISVGITTRIFDHVNYPKPKLPTTIAIDEFKGNAGNTKFQCILTNPKKKKVLDILKSRKADDLYAYFSSFDQNTRNNVKYVVMDMSNLFKQVVHTCFPKAQIVADKFHVARQVTWALERVRKEEQKKFGDHRRKYFKKSRWILLKRKEKLKEDELIQLENMLQVSSKIRNAYMLKELFYKFMDSQDLQEAKKSLKIWNIQVQLVDLKEFNKCFETFNRWQPYILNAFNCGFTNGYTEGTNNKIKVLKRNCYGVKNFNRFRNRILHMMAA